MALFAPLTIGRDALLAHERALRVTGHNIANVDTPGFSRQRPVLVATHVDDNGFGSGVRVAHVQQAVDAYLEARRLASASTLAGAKTGRDLLDRLQDLFPVGDQGIAVDLQRFFTAANAVATSPQDLAARGDLLARGEQLAGEVQRVAGGIADLQREIDSRIGEVASQAVDDTQAIARLNHEIVLAEATGGEASDIRDERRQALASLAEKLEVRVIEQADGSVNVFASSGQALVLGFDAAAPGTALDQGLVGLDGNALSKVGTLDGAGNVVAFAGSPGGTIGALLTLRDQTLVGNAADLDRLAVTLRDAVNAVQTNPAGRDLDGAVGVPFFAATGARDLTVNLTDPRGIAAAQGADPGDNANALALAAVGSTTFGGLGGATLDEFYGTLQSTVGSQARGAADGATLQEQIAGTLDAQRDAISGVSLDEEFTDLIRYQRGFQAAARLIATSDKLLDDLLGLVQ